MHCAHCQSEVPDNSKFCPHCGRAVSPTIIKTNQDIGVVEGQVIGSILGEEEISSGLENTTNQKIDIVESSGLVIGTIVGEQAEVVKAFGKLQKMVLALPDSHDKLSAQAAIQELQIEAKKGEQANESKMNAWFSSLAKLAPDIWEVAINTFTNPAIGVSTVLKKVAERAKLENMHKG